MECDGALVGPPHPRLVGKLLPGKPLPGKPLLGKPLLGV